MEWLLICALTEECIDPMKNAGHDTPDCTQVYDDLTQPCYHHVQSALHILVRNAFPGSHFQIRDEDIIARKMPVITRTELVTEVSDSSSIMNSESYSMNDLHHFETETGH